MANLLRVAGRRWRVAFRSHLAAAVIVGAVVTAWLLFWGYAEAMGQSISDRLQAPAFPADVILAADDSVYLSSTYASKLHSYRQLTVGTAYGQLPLGAVTSALHTAPLPNPDAGEVWIPSALAAEWQIPLGADFPIRVQQGYGYKTVSATVAGIYQAYQYDPAIFVSGNWLTGEGISLSGQEFSLFNLNPNNRQQFSRWLAGAGSDVQVISAGSIVSQARNIVTGTFSNGSQAIAMLFLFMTLGVGTFSLLSYMDSRRELAILKSMGLRPAEIGALFVMEAALTAILGYSLALVAASLVADQSSLPLILTAGIALRALAYALLAFSLATVIPYTLARKASVTELMLNRPVPLFRNYVGQLTRHYPLLEARLAAGLRCVKLPVTDGQFHGICFRRAGQSVKQGETIAWESYAFGMGERNYLAPCSGEVMECDLSQGLLTIKPE